MGAAARCVCRCKQLYSPQLLWDQSGPLNIYLRVFITELQEAAMCDADTLNQPNLSPYLCAVIINRVTLMHAFPAAPLVTNEVAEPQKPSGERRNANTFACKLYQIEFSKTFNNR